MNDKATILKRISDQLDRMNDFGHLQISVKKHRGEYSTMDTVHVTSQKFTDNEPNVTAAAQMLSMFKSATSSSQQLRKKTTLGFSVVINDLGKAEVMQVQDFRKL